MAFRQFKPNEWVSELESGLDFRRKFGLEEAWGELEAIYYNVHSSMSNDGPNIIMSTADAILSALTVPQPRVTVRPERPEAVDKAPFVENIDNLLLRELKVNDEVDTAALHAYLFGVGIVKIGFDSEFGFDPSYDAGGNFQRLGFTFTQLSPKGDRRLENDSGVTPGMPWVKAVSPHDIVVPWGTMRVDNSPWIAHRFVRQIDDLKADPKYSNTQRLEPSMSMEDFVGSYKSTIRLWNPSGASRKGYNTRRYSSSSRGSRETQFVELYEIHDRRTGKILVISPGHDSFLRNDINALQIQNVLPFTTISFTPKSRSFWTTSDAYYLHAAQMEISDLAVQRTKIRRQAVLKFLVDKEVISDEELAKILSSDVGTAATIEAGQDINKAILPIRTHPDQTLIYEEEHIRRNAREQVGFSRNQMGEFAGGRKTATEAQIVDSAASLRMSRRGIATKKLYEHIIAVMNNIVFEHWTSPQLVEIMGEDGAQTWEEVTGPDMKSRYSYKVEFSDDAELRQRRMEALNFYMTLSQDPSIDPVALRQYLADQYSDPAFTRLFNAELQDAMRAMRLAGGVVGPEGAVNGQQGQPGSQVQGFQMPQLPGVNGAGGDNSGGPPVAGGRINA